MPKYLPALLATFGLIAALAPTVASAQIASGPDSTLAPRVRDAAERNRDARSAARAPDEPGGGDRNRPVVSEGAKMDADCDKAFAGAGASGGGEGVSRGDPRADRAACRKLSDYDVATAPIQEIRRVTRHTATIGGRALAYTATAGTLTIRDDEGKPTASFFYVAYTADGGPRRPVTFMYNGGPGSSSLWLHMGSVGPVRVATDSPRATHNAPFDVVNNSDSLLDKTDLVFIDAMGAGYSRPVGDTKLQAFWGTDPDIDAFARAIERYLTVNDRWNSPKFIFGESYGTTRSAGLSYRLQQDGAQLNGVILLSSILNYGRRDPGFDQELINYMPSFAAAAAYHNRLQTAPTDIAAYLREVREWARGPYALALAKGQDLPDADRAAIAHQMSIYTGLSERFILDNDLRVSASRFRKELLRDQRLTLGRYDARFTGEDTDAAGETPDYDPSDTGITGAFVSVFHHYLASDLDFTSEMTYRPTYYSAGLQWSFQHRPPGGRGAYDLNMADVALDLSAAMRENPNLKVYSLNGIYDFATPFFGTEYDLGHMQLNAATKGNVRFAYYPSGHMVYLNTDALKTMKADLARFYDEAVR